MDMMIVMLIILVAFEIAASKWGFDSTDGIDSQEWERRRAWRAFH